MKPLRSLTLLVATLCVAAQYECSTDTPEPLGTPTATAFDARLLGAWRCVDERDPDESGLARVYALNDREYAIVTGSGAPGDAIETARAFSVELDGERFLNVQLLRFEAPGDYQLIGYAFEGPDRFAFRIADFGSSDNKPRTPRAVEDYVRRKLAAGTLYDDGSLSCTRSTTAVSPTATIASPTTKPHQIPAASAPAPKASQAPTGNPITQ